MYPTGRVTKNVPAGGRIRGRGGGENRLRLTTAVSRLVAQRGPASRIHGAEGKGTQAPRKTRELSSSLILCATTFLAIRSDHRRLFSLRFFSALWILIQNESYSNFSRVSRRKQSVKEGIIQRLGSDWNRPGRPVRIKMCKLY